MERLDEQAPAPPGAAARPPGGQVTAPDTAPNRTGTRSGRSSDPRGLSDPRVLNRPGCGVLRVPQCTRTHESEILMISVLQINFAKRLDLCVTSLQN